MRTLSITDVLSMIDKAVQKAGSRRALARQWKCSSIYIREVQKQTRPPGPLILDRLGLTANDPVATFVQSGSPVSVVPERVGRGPARKPRQRQAA
jgi:hypothetical protein